MHGPVPRPPPGPTAICVRAEMSAQRSMPNTAPRKSPTASAGPWTAAKGGACGGRRWHWRASWPLCSIGFWADGTDSSGARTRPPRQPHNGKEAHSSERGPGGSAFTRSLRRDAEMAREVPLQWPGADPETTPGRLLRHALCSMRWRSRADHGQRHQIGDWMHSELDDQRPITEQWNRNFD